ncbi:hypothetical protein FRC04_005218 [Tulasnella sp. 424]|nr:hypothetical protein FRC04_005218 [Tulasnella sp. 424]
MAPRNVAYGIAGIRTRVVVKEIPLYRRQTVSSLLDAVEDSDEDETLVVEQAQVLRAIFAELLDATERLRHINIVPILGFRVDILKPYVVQPRYYPFEQWLIAHPELRIEERTRLLRDVAEGLRFLHETNLDAMPYHGRVHLNNVLLRRQDSPGQPMVAAISDTYLQMTIENADKILTDKFGPNLSSTPSSALGFQGYIAPEFFEVNTPYGSQLGDVWAFGFTVLHAITRDWPPYLSIRLDPSGRLVRRAPDPLAYPETLPSNDPLWTLIFGATRTVAYRHNMAEIVVALEARLSWDPEKAPHERSGDDFPETMLDASDHAGVSEVWSSEISELAGLLRFDPKMPLVSDTQHAKVKFAHWETFGAAPMPVAVKEIKIRLIDDSREETDRVVRRMLREAKVWQSLEHPYVLPLLGFKTRGPNPCLVSPWCPEGHLESYFRKFPDMEFSARLRLVIQVALGLQFIHSKGIMHGDIKPKNVLIFEGRPAICDFGTARFVEAQASGSTTSGVAARTVKYASPERLKGDSKVKNTRSDIWSFAGLILYALSLKAPYHAYGSRETQDKILNGIVPQPEEHPLLPRESGLWSILLRCWLLDPNSRPTMPDIVNLLRDESDSHGVEWPRDD